LSVVSPIVAGLTQTCPACGKGKVFSKYLTFADRCGVCHADFRIADAGDGPAVFVMFVVGAIVVPVAVVLQLGLHAPSFVVLGVAFGLTLALSLALLPIFKAVLFALQWHHKAGEARTPGMDQHDE
jgi:uncharacterized protein (DUF983 family)